VNVSACRDACFSKRSSSDSRWSARSPKPIGPDHYLHGFHSTGTIGTFGAAASAAKLLKLPPPKIAHALGIAASMSSGIRVNFGSMTKPLHAGRAAENGVTAVELASRGFTAGDDPLDGEWGFFQVLGGGADLARIVPALGKPHSIIEPGVSIKPYPCGSLGHPTMDAMLTLVTKNDVKPEQIVAVRVRAGTNILNPLRYKTAKTELEAKFCLPFMMASIALRRRAGIREFTDEFVASAPVQAMMARVETVFDAEIEARGFDKMRSRVEVDLADGRSSRSRPMSVIAAAPTSRSRETSCSRSSPIAPVSRCRPNARVTRSIGSSRSIASRTSAS
jgi:2-methylcitrate dehydratase PrpD